MSRSSRNKSSVADSLKGFPVAQDNVKRDVVHARILRADRFGKIFHVVAHLVAPIPMFYRIVMGVLVNSSVPCPTSTTWLSVHR